EDAWTLLTTTHPVLDKPVNQGAWEDLLRRVALSPAARDERRYAAFESYLLSKGVTTSALPVARLAVNPHASLMDR
ncbi:ABC transporter ATP-binding protein, partial [Tritonibacter sp. SIMBA_163]